jgi:hypothetical protein
METFTPGAGFPARTVRASDGGTPQTAKLFSAFSIALAGSNDGGLPQRTVLDLEPVRIPIR